MNTPHPPLSQRAGYTTAQIRRLFGHSDGHGNITPLHPNTVLRWRQSGQIPYYQVNRRCIRYPRAAVDAMLEVRRHEGASRREEEWYRGREGELRGMYRL